MNNLQLLVVCCSAIMGVCGVASIFVSGWVKATHIAELKIEIDKLWEQVSKINILETKINNIEDGIRRIENALAK